MKAINLLLPVALSTMLSGCVISINGDDWESDHGDWRDTQSRNKSTIEQMSLGASIQSLRDALGEPDFTDVFQRHGESFTVLYYRTHRVKEDGRTTRDETTPVVFVDGEMVGFGNAAIDRATGPQ
ncbi:MAG: DUF3192 domain-containing protein [Pseudomonadales bacterium]|nr:DUF3192 domain-containing protein [Pseudomonadales bacterium]